MDYVYLIKGDCNYLLDKELKKIIVSNNVIRINYGDCSIKDIINEASYFSMENTVKYLVVKNCEPFLSKTDECDLLIKYLNNPNIKTKIIFIMNNIDSRKKIVKIIKEKYKYIEIPKVDYKSIYKYIADFTKDNNFSIDYDSQKYLVGLYGLNLDLICNEINKIFLYYNKSRDINIHDCEMIISKPIDNNVFHFLDACINKDYSKVLMLYNDLKKCKIDESVIIILLYKEYKKIYLVKKLAQQHCAFNNIVKKLQLQDWQVEKLYNQSQNFSERDLIAIIKSLGKLDYQLKTGKIGKDLLIYNYIIKWL